MTQTIKKTNGRHEVEIWADYGSGRTRYKYSVYIYKITLPEYLEEVESMGEDYWSESQEEILERLKLFKKGHAWYTECSDNCERRYHASYKDAHDSASSDYDC